MVVSIIGRPNVGKSSLFNMLLKKMHKNTGSIAFDQMGVTRDFHFGHLELEHPTLPESRRHFVNLVDTGGFFPQYIEANNENEILYSIEQHATIAIDESDFILLIMDIKAGVTPIDNTLFQLVQRSKKPFIIVANKADDVIHHQQGVDFYSLGIKEEQLFFTSSAHKKGISELLECITDFYLKNTKLDEEIESEQDRPKTELNLSIIGTPNAGKSTLMNSLLGYERSLVTPIAGTTIDPVEDEFDITIPARSHPLNPEQTQLRIKILDTAGIRRIKSLRTQESPLESLGVYRALKSMDEAHIVLMVIDCTKSITHQDRRLIEIALEKGCSVIVLLNKVDLLDNLPKQERKEKLITQDPSIAPYVQIIPVSAKKKINLEDVKKSITKSFLARLKPFKSHEVLQCLQDLTDSKSYFPNKSSKNPLKIKFAQLVRNHPPTFILFANHPQEVSKVYRRYLTNGLRKHFRLPNCPIHLVFKRNEESKNSYR